MKYLKQFGIILGLSLLGELLNYLIPLPVPASIYGLALMFLCLHFKVIKLGDVKETAVFLIEIMPLMFIPAAVGLVNAWGIIRSNLLAAAARRQTGGGEMSFFENSVFFGVVISLLAYGAGSLLQNRFKLALFNPLLISVAATIAVLAAAGIDYDVYYSGAQYLSYLLTPATVCLAVPLYEKLEVLKKNWRAILIGIVSGVLTTLLCILAMSLMFGLSHEEYVTLLPKSITTAIGMGVSEELGGYVTLTVAVIIITGVLGNIFAPLICRVFRIREPIAKGIAIGTSSHAVGTAKAMEMGEVEGAMSSLSIAISGLLTVVGASVFAQFL